MMQLSELELKRGQTTVLKADLTAVKLNIDVTEKLFLTIKNANGITEIAKEVTPCTLITVDSKHLLVIKHQ